MDKVQKIILIFLITISAMTWILSQNQQENMMTTMSAGSSLNPISLSLFTGLWTAGMAAMMFPAVSPMIFLYNRLITDKGNSNENTQVVQEGRNKPKSVYPVKTIIFIGCYLFIWALAGITLLLGWSVLFDRMTMFFPEGRQNLNLIYGAILIISGIYQFTPLKSSCLGYCESPIGFFMRRWSDGTKGAVKMGLHHGIYCLGCCWPYFLLMVALGWMNVVAMGIFAAIIFGEKMWSKGIWVARAAGVGLVIVGILISAGILPTITTDSMSMA